MGNHDKLQKWLAKECHAQAIKEIKEKYSDFITGSTEDEIIHEALLNFLDELKNAKDTMTEFTAMDK